MALTKVQCYSVTNAFQSVFQIKYMLNKNSLAVKKVRGQSEATMAISDQNL